jgi:predicted amidohydrolase
MKIKVAAVQMAFGENVPKNLRTMETTIGRLARKRVRLAVFPECCLSGYLIASKDRDWPAIAAGVARMRELAREHRMALIFGTAWPNGRQKPFNSVFAVDERGRIVARYDKCHPTKGDLKMFSPGRRLARVVRLAGARLAMQICFDVRFPEPARLAALAGAQLLVYSFAAYGRQLWKLPVLEGSLRCRAAENGVFLAAANRGHRQLFVASRILDPNGRDLAAARVGRPDVITATIDPAEAHHSFPKQRRPDLYALSAKS